MATALQASAGNEENDGIVLGEEEAYKVYLTEKVRRREITQTQADARLKEYEARNLGKQWISPVRDAGELRQSVSEIAEEMGTWWGRVWFKQYNGKAYVILKGNPGLRENLTGTTYKLTNPKFVSWQITRSSIIKSARSSARAGLWIVCAADVLDYIFRDNATLGQMFGHLLVDIPSVAIASVAGVLAQIGTVAAASAMGVTVIASGPLIVGFLVAVGVGYALSKVDERYHIADKLGEAIDQAIGNLQSAYRRLRQEAQNEAEDIIREFERARSIVNILKDADHLWQGILQGSPQLPRWQIMAL